MPDVTVDYPEHLTSDRLRAQESSKDYCEPIIQGGQGRTADEVSRRADIWTNSLTIAALIMAAALIAWAIWGQS